ncbi:glycosyltransferase family 4 protein [Arthrobacter nitrophenolicus]|uniref:glycosyltransferase family 4 protein n=1 Tax=Arthrobacter nitrophenolicus TaxID=683150 RepID=UPI00389A9313
MKIAVCAPATLSLLEPYIDGPINSNGYPFPGTAELILEYLGLGHSVVLITTATDISEPLRYIGEKLEIRILPARVRARSRALDFFRKERRWIAQALRCTNPDVIHAHWTYEFAIPSRNSGVPNLVTVHDWGPSIALHNKHPYWYLRAMMQIWCLSLNGELSAPTDYLAQKVRRYYRRQCSVIPNGVDVWAAPAEIGPRVQNGRVGMLNVGFSERKNVKTALKAWKIVLKEHPGYQLFLAGPGYEPNGPAHSWAIENLCDKGVIFEGELDPSDRRKWYEEKSIFLHTSREESFGMVLIEAMAAKTPVIAGKASGAVPEITRGAALLVDIDNPAEVARTLLQVLSDEGELQLRSALGRQVAELYDKRVVARQYVRLLEQLASGENIAAGMET